MDSTPYAVGDAIGGGLVIFNGSVTNFKATELGPGVEYFFVYYSLDSTPDYSAGVTQSVTLATYEAGGIVGPAVDAETGGEALESDGEGVAGPSKVRLRDEGRDIGVDPSHGNPP